MGCWISAPKRSGALKNTTFDGAYVAATPPTRGLSRKLWRSRTSNASSSGVSSGCNTPVRHGSKAYSSSSRCSSPESATQTPVKKRPQRSPPNDSIYKNLPEFLRNLKFDFELDENDGVQYINESRGYYTEDESSDCSTPLPPGLKNTQSSCDDDNTSNNDHLLYSECGLDMEMRLMGKAFGIMPKTSSPAMQRRHMGDMTFDVAASKPPSASYEKWQKYLQMTPTYALHNITNIPEAIAGRFCPVTFPGFTDMRAIKKEVMNHRHHHHHHHQQHQHFEENIAETIIMELPVPTISTEL